MKMQIANILDGFSVCEVVRPDQKWLGRTTFSTRTIELNLSAIGDNQELKKHVLAHEAGHVYLRSIGKACGGFAEEVKACRIAEKLGYPLP